MSQPFYVPRAVLIRLQYEYYTELAKPTRKDILLKAIETANKLRGLFPEVTFEELAVEVGV
jgi:hypothetical protein